MAGAVSTSSSNVALGYGALGKGIGKMRALGTEGGADRGGIQGARLEPGVGRQRRSDARRLAGQPALRDLAQKGV